MVSLKILVIDDDDMSRELLRLLLLREGYTVVTAASGAAAISALENAETCPDLVLADLQMPGISGRTLAEKLREAHPALRLLAMSGSTPLAEVLQSYDGFLLKPFNMQQLATAISRPNSAHKIGPPPALRPETQVLDMETYRKLSAAMKPDKLDQLYRLCLDDVRRRIAIMRIAADSGDDAAYRREAHAIKGGCGMVGATELQTIAASGENAGIPANHVATLHEFLKAAERLESMLFANSKNIQGSTVVEPARSNA